MTHARKRSAIQDLRPWCMVQGCSSLLTVRSIEVGASDCLSYIHTCICTHGDGNSRVELEDTSDSVKVGDGTSETSFRCVRNRAGQISPRIFETIKRRKLEV
eukprot:scaffold6186_cov21-Prasinocladus_malaysianus.AAC.2